MEMEIITKRENPLLKRTEVEFVLHHQGETTPPRDHVRDMIASQLGGSKENVIVDHMDSQFGRASTKGMAKLYESQEAAKEYEPEHLLIRNGLVEEAA